jgi:CspA family cold shock protein
MTGKIARVTDRGFGFITPDGGNKDVFFHAQSLAGVTFDELREGDAVTFEIEEGPKGPAAVNVQKA